MAAQTNRYRTRQNRGGAGRVVKNIEKAEEESDDTTQTDREAHEDEHQHREKRSKIQFSEQFQLFGRLKPDQKIVFSVNDRRIGMFKYNNDEQVPNFVMQNQWDEDCVDINCHPEEIVLADYFYWAHQFNNTCPDKPTNTQGHENILVHLLNFFAHAYNVNTITLKDESSKDINKCISIPSHVFLIAGKGGFYKKVAGFENPLIDRAAEIVGAKLNGKRTLKEIAQDLLDNCAKKKMYEEKEVTLLTRALNEQMQSMGATPEYTRSPPSHPDEFTALQADSLRADREVINAAEDLKKYVFIDIITA